MPLERIEHRSTKVRRPRNNGFVERMHRTLLDEHFRVKGRTPHKAFMDGLKIWKIKAAKELNKKAA